jgi:hypothetical protein
MFALGHLLGSDIVRAYWSEIRWGFDDERGGSDLREQWKITKRGEIR